MRMIVIKEDTDLEALSGTLLRARLGASKTDAALESLKALNPHVVGRLRPGSVVLVPDEPSFKPSVTDPVANETFEDFRKLVHDDLLAAAKKLKTGNAARAAERAEVTATVKGAAGKRLIESDAELKQQVADATKAIKEEQQHDEQAAQSSGSRQQGGACQARRAGQAFGLMSRPVG